MHQQDENKVTVDKLGEATKPPPPLKQPSFKAVSSASFSNIASGAIELNSIRSVTSNPLSPSSSAYNNMDTPSFATESVRGLHDLLHWTDGEDYMFHPGSAFISGWTLVSIIILIYIALTVPVFITFSKLQLPPGYIIIDIIIDVFYMADIAVIFRTGIVLNEKRPDLVVMNSKLVAESYLKSWFVIDLFCGIPFATIGFITSVTLPKNEVKLGKLLKITKLLRLVKLSKLGKANMFVDKIDEAYLDIIVSHPHLISVLRMVLNTVVAYFAIHYLACGWWGVGKLHDNNWIRDAGANNMSASDQYLFSMYWVITTMATVGYGDISPVNGSERMYAIFVMVLGCSLYGLLIAKITSVVGEYEANRRKIAEKMDAVAIYIHKKNIRPTLRKQILVYFRHFLQKNSIIDEGQMLQDLSSRLREKVILHLVSSVVTNNPFFVKLDHHITDVFSIMHLQIFHRGQHIAHKGEQSEDMVVLLVGQAVILNENKESRRAGQGLPKYPLFELHPGATIGEKCALGLEDSFQVTVRAVTNCEVYVLIGSELMNLIGKRSVARVRKILQTNVQFRIRLRCYRVTRVQAKSMGRMRRLVLSLPPDTVSRSWKSGLTHAQSMVLKQQHQLKQQQLEKELLEARFLAQVQGVGNNVDGNQQTSVGINGEIEKAAKAMENNPDSSVVGVLGSDTFHTASKDNTPSGLVTNKVAELASELGVIKTEMIDMKSVLNKSVEDNSCQMKELKGQLEGIMKILMSSTNKEA